VDLVTTLPLESIILSGMGIGPEDHDDRALFVGLIHWIKLVSAHMVTGLPVHMRLVTAQTGSGMPQCFSV
jgi:hypothetical protein